jgi:hypothetical protein
MIRYVMNVMLLSEFSDEHIVELVVLVVLVFASRSCVVQDVLLHQREVTDSEA